MKEEPKETLARALRNPARILIIQDRSGQTYRLVQVIDRINDTVITIERGWP